MKRRSGNGEVAPVRPGLFAMLKFTIPLLLSALAGVAALVLIGSDGLATSHGVEPRREAVARDEAIDLSQNPELAESDKVELSEALALAESHVHGNVVDADRKMHNGHHAWDVEMVEDGQKVRVWVEARDGRVQVQR